MYACVLLAAIVQQSRGYLNPFFFFFDWAAAAGLGWALRFSFIWPGPSSFLLRCAPYSSLRLPILFLHHAAAAADRDFRQLKFRSRLNTLADDNHMDIHPPVSLSLSRLLSTPIFSDGTFFVIIATSTADVHSTQSRTCPSMSSHQKFTAQIKSRTRIIPNITAAAILHLPIADEPNESFIDVTSSIHPM